MDELRRKRVLVTGGAGFLGSHLCRRLLVEGSEVICLDNFLTGCPAAVADLLGMPGFSLVEHDVIDALPRLPRLDVIFNLACPASPPQYQKDPVHTLRTCVVGACNVLEAARSHGAKVVQASTSEVYGDPLVATQPETYRGNVNPVGPRACYDEGKRCAETLFADYARKGLARASIVRIFNTYGPGMPPDDGRVVSTFAVQALTGKPLTVYGDGTQTRSLCHVDDMIEGLMRMMVADDAFFGPVNLGNPDPHTVIALACRIRELARSSSPIEHRPLPADDPMQRCPDISLAKRRLGWEPKIRLNDGLRRTLSHFRNLLAHSRETGSV